MEQIQQKAVHMNCIKADIYFATPVTGSVFMRRFQLFLGQCVERLFRG